MCKTEDWQKYACVGNKSVRATVPKHQCQGNHENFQLRFRDLQIGTIQDFAGFGHFRFELDYVLPQINYDIYIYTDKYCKYDKAKSQCRVALPNSMGSETVQGIYTWPKPEPWAPIIQAPKKYSKKKKKKKTRREAIEKIENVVWHKAFLPFPHFPISFLFHFFHRATATSWICCNHDLELDFISAWPGWDMEIRAPPQNQEASMDAPWWVSQLKTSCLHLAVLQSLPRLAVITGQSNEGMAGMADIGWFCKSIGSMRKEHVQDLRARPGATTLQTWELKQLKQLKQTCKKWTKWTGWTPWLLNYAAPLFITKSIRLLWVWANWAASFCQHCRKLQNPPPAMRVASRCFKKPATLANISRKTPISASTSQILTAHMTPHVSIWLSTPRNQKHPAIQRDTCTYDKALLFPKISLFIVAMLQDDRERERDIAWAWTKLAKPSASHSIK